VKDALAQRLDRAVALLSLQTGQRQTRTSLIVKAIEAEVDRIIATGSTADPNEPTR